MAVATISSFVDGLCASQLLNADQLDEVRRLQETTDDTRALANDLLRRGWLTAFQINQILLGKGRALTIGPYILLERIGEGGMGQVFKAQQKVLQRVVALKVVRKECLGNPKAILRFQREIRAAGQLSHPHIVRAYDADQINGAYYIAMEYIEGDDLAKLVSENGPLSVEQACEYIRQAALGLQHAHERGLVHRDIKPANLLVAKAVSSDRRGPSGLIARPRELSAKRSSGMLPRADMAQRYPWGVVKILDMGLARCTDPFTGRASTHLTQIGSLMGTPEYIAPEQARDSHNSDVRADLYSLGCTLYFLLCAEPPFADGTLTEKLLQHQLATAAPVDRVRRDNLRAWKTAHPTADVSEKNLHVPAPVRDVIRKLLEKHPDDRYQTPIELANDLQDIVRQIADGTLAMDPAETTPTETFAAFNSAAPRADKVASDAPTVVQAIVLLTPNPSRQPRSVAFAALLLSGLGGLVFVVVMTVVAVLISRHSLTHAGADATESPVKTRSPEESSWRITLKKAVQKKISWDEARQELLRNRPVTSTGAHAKKIDELLAKMPTPFDALERGAFAGMLPPGLPAEVVGVYGFAKPIVAKPVTSLAVSPNGRWLATNEDNGVRIFDPAGSVLPYKIPAHTSRVTRVAISPDGWLLASASEDGTVRLWDLATRNRIFSFEKHGKPITQIAFNHAGTLLASAGRDGTIRLWNPRTGEEARRFESQVGDVTVLAFTPDDRQIFWGGNSRELRWTSLQAADASLGKFDTKSIGQRVLAFQPAGNLVVLGGAQGEIKICAWDGATLVHKTSLKKQQSQVHQVAFAPDGKTFVSVGPDPIAVLWDAQTLQAMKSINAPRSVGLSTAFAPDGRHFVVGGSGNQVFVMRLATYDMKALAPWLE